LAGTPILGGMLGMITSLDGINKISSIMGLYNSEIPLNSVLCSGKGGVLAVIAGALLIAFVEKAIRFVIPDSVDVVFTPLLTMFLCVIPYIIFIMPLFGYASGRHRMALQHPACLRMSLSGQSRATSPQRSSFRWWQRACTTDW
jgi:PTS system IIB component, Glc family (TC 4.A.1)/PTS system IIC component, Glc family (TC 4.A.1)